MIWKSWFNCYAEKNTTVFVGSQDSNSSTFAMGKETSEKAVGTMVWSPKEIRKGI